MHVILFNRGKVFVKSDHGLEAVYLYQCVQMLGFYLFISLSVYLSCDRD